MFSSNLHYNELSSRQAFGQRPDALSPPLSDRDEFPGPLATRQHPVGDLPLNERTFIHADATKGTGVILERMNHLRSTPTSMV